MQLELDRHVLTVKREKGDPSYSDSEWGSAESRLLYHIKKILNAQGMDLIKKRMWKDGHMVSDDQLYLRTRSKASAKPHIYIWNGSWQVQDAGHRLMEKGYVLFAVERDVFKQEISNEQSARPTQARLRP